MGMTDSNTEAGQTYSMEDGTSSLQLAFEMAKQGLEDIISVVEILDHDAVAVAKAKEGLQEVVNAVDILHRDALTSIRDDGQDSRLEGIDKNAVLSPTPLSDEQSEL